MTDKSEKQTDVHQGISYVWSWRDFDNIKSVAEEDIAWITICDDAHDTPFFEPNQVLKDPSKKSISEKKVLVFRVKNTSEGEDGPEGSLEEIFKPQRNSKYSANGELDPWSIAWYFRFIEAEKKGYFRVDIMPDVSDGKGYEKYRKQNQVDCFRVVYNRVTEVLGFSQHDIMMGVRDKIPVELALIFKPQIQKEKSFIKNIQAASQFYLSTPSDGNPQYTPIEIEYASSTSFYISVEELKWSNSPEQDSSKGLIPKLIKSVRDKYAKKEDELKAEQLNKRYQVCLSAYVADEYANFLYGLMSVAGVEGYSRRVKYIEQSMDRHLALVERLHAMQRRVEQEYHPIKRWALQIQTKIGFLFHSLVDSINDLAMEMEQNTRQVDRSLVETLSESKPLFTQLEGPYPLDNKNELVDYLKQGGLFRKKLDYFKGELKSNLDNKRELLNRVASMVDVTDQRATNRVLNRLQSFGAMFASVAILVGLIGQFAVDDIKSLTSSLLHLDGVAWVAGGLCSALALYAAGIWWMKYRNKVPLGLTNLAAYFIMILYAVAVLLLFNEIFSLFNVPMEEIDSKGWVFLSAIGILAAYSFAVILVRSYHLNAWIQSRASNDEDKTTGVTTNILKQESLVLDYYESGVTFSEQKTKATDEFKTAWDSLSAALDYIDQRVCQSEESETFTAQIDRIRDEVLISRAASQVILRLPESIREFRGDHSTAKKVFFESNWKFDPVPNHKKIFDIDEGKALPAYLPPYTLDKYIQYAEEKKDVKKDVKAMLVKSICTYLDDELLEMIKDYENSNRNRDNTEIEERIKYHLPREMANFVLDNDVIELDGLEFKLSDVIKASKEALTHPNCKKEKIFEKVKGTLLVLPLLGAPHNKSVDPNYKEYLDQLYDLSGENIDDMKDVLHDLPRNSWALWKNILKGSSRQLKQDVFNDEDYLRKIFGGIVKEDRCAELIDLGIEESKLKKLCVAPDPDVWEVIPNAESESQGGQP